MRKVNDMKFLMQEPRFSPLRAQEGSISEPSAESKLVDSTLNQGAFTANASVPKSSDSLEQIPYTFQGMTLEQAAKYHKQIVDSVKHLNPSQELDPAGLSAQQPGAKLDKGKVDILRGAIQYFPRTLKAIAHISELGARKYSWKGWEVVPDGIRRYGAALMRHLFHEDPFSTDNGPGGLGEEVIHAAQVAWNACARCELILKELEERQFGQANKQP